MAISIDWGTSVIFVPRADMPILQSSPFEVRQLDVNQFRLDLKGLEESVEGMPFQKTHDHNTETVLSGISYARLVEVLPPYTIEFENGQYGVSLTGANNNVLDRKVPNQVSLLANNSAGLINSEALNDQSFLDARVWIHTVKGVAGTSYPIGTPTLPSSNYNDAYMIATTRSLSRYHLDGTLLFVGGQDVTDTDWLGSSAIKSAVVFANQDVTDATFEALTVTGTCSGRAGYRDCLLGGTFDLTGFQGFAVGCGINADITLEALSTESILFDDCTSVIAGTARPNVDCNGTLADIHFRGWIGGLHISGFTGGGNMSIDVHSGTIELDNTNTAGTIVVRGVCELIDNTGPGCTVIKEGTVTELVGDNVKIDELHRLQGLDDANPLTVTPTARSTGDISQTISGDGQNVTIVTRD